MFRILRNLFALLFLLSNAYIIASVEAKAAAKTSTPINLAEVETKVETKVETLKPSNDNVIEIRTNIKGKYKCIGISSKTHDFGNTGPIPSLTVQECGVSKATQWIKTKVGHDTFKFINVATRRCFDIFWNWTHGNAAIVAYYWSGKDNQLWRLRKKGNEYFIVAKKGGKYGKCVSLDRWGSTTITSNGCSTSWTFVNVNTKTKTIQKVPSNPLEEGEIVEIRNYYFWKCIGTREASGRIEIPPITVQECGVSKATQWRKSKVGHNSFKFINVLTKKSISVYKGTAPNQDQGKNDGNPFLDYYWTGRSNQIFTFRKIGNEYLIKNKYSNKCIHITGGGRRVSMLGSSIVQKTCGNKKEQRWTFVNVKDKAIPKKVAPRNSSNEEERIRTDVYEIKNSLTGRCVGLTHNKPVRTYTKPKRQFDKIIYNHCGVGKLTQWIKTPFKNGKFILTNVATGYVWDGPRQKKYHHTTHYVGGIVVRSWNGFEKGRLQTYSIRKKGNSKDFNIVAVPEHKQMGYWYYRNTDRKRWHYRKIAGKCISDDRRRKIGDDIRFNTCGSSPKTLWKFVRPTQIKTYPVPKNQLADGIYEIRSNGANKCIGVSNFHNQMIMTINLHYCGVSKATQWRKKQIGNNRFVLINVLNGLVWETYGERFILSYYKGGYNQRLSLRKKGNEFEIIINDNKCADISGGRKGRKGRKLLGMTIDFSKCNNKWSQKWSFVKPTQQKTYPVPRNEIPDGIYEIQNPHFKKCIGLAGFYPGVSYNLKVVQYKCGISNITQWKKTQLANGYSQLINVQTGYALTTQGIRLVCGDWRGGVDQIYRIRRQTGNIFQIINKGNDKVVMMPDKNGFGFSYPLTLFRVPYSDKFFNFTFVKVKPPKYIESLRNPSEKCVIIYEHCNYKGLAKHICGPKKLASLGKFNKKISSVKVGKDAYIILASSKNLEGKLKILTKTNSCLVNDKWNDLAQSLMVGKNIPMTTGRPVISNPCPVESLPRNPSNGCVIIYQDCNYKGLAQHICGPKNLASLGILNKRISSIKIGKDAKVTLFGFKNFKGCSKSYTRSDSCFVNGDWNDLAQSLRVDKTVSGPVDGVWEIKSKGAGKCIGASKTNKYKGLPSLELQHCSESTNTQWRKSKVVHDQFRLINMGTGYVWDVSQGNRNNYARLSSQKWHGSQSQQFTLRKRGNDNDYQIIAKHSNKCVDIVGGKVKHYGAPIHQWTCHNGWNQRWSFVKYKPYAIRLDNTIYEITNPHTRKCVGLYMYKGKKALHLKECGTNKETQWRLHEVRRGQFKIISVAFNLYWDIYGNSKHNGARAILHKWHGGNNQHFRKISHDRIQAVHSGKCLDIHAGTYIQQWKCHRGHNQQWKIVKCPEIFPIAQPPAPEPKNGIWEIKNKGSGKCLGLSKLVKGQVKGHRGEIHRWLSLQECSKTKETQWKKQNVRRGEVKFINVATGLVWDVHNVHNVHSRRNKINGAWLKQFKWNGGAHQKWRLVHFRGEWLIKSINSHKCVEIAKGKKHVGAYIYQWDCHHRWNQQWTFVVPKLPKREHKVSIGLVNAVNGKAINDLSEFKITARNKKSNKLYLAKGQRDGTFKIPNMHEGNYDFVINGNSEFLELKDNRDLTKANHNDIKHWTFMVSPKMKFKDMRVVLSWSAQPHDLDAIITVKDDQTHSMERIDYENKSSRGGLVKLDIDNIESEHSNQGYGPETMTLQSKIFEKSSDINYYVDNYEDTIAIAGSEAVVQVYYHNRLIKKYKIPTDQMTDQIWHVFRINKGKVEDINKLKSSFETGFQE